MKRCKLKLFYHRRYNSLNLQHKKMEVNLFYSIAGHNTRVLSDNFYLLWRKFATSLIGLKPQRPVKGVKAMAISGLWLGSLYISGWFLWRASACTCMKIWQNKQNKHTLRVNLYICHYTRKKVKRENCQ